MKIALVADLHGNRPALSALSDYLQTLKPDEIWCLGDLVGKGPSSDLTFDWVVQHCQVILRGNWDEGIGRLLYERDAFYHKQLGPERLRKLASLPLEKHLVLSGRKIRLIHGRPVMGRLLNIQEPKESLLPLLEPDYNLLVYADCHRQGLRTLRGQVANIGSVGNALGSPMVQFAVLEGVPGAERAPLEIRFLTLPYDNQAAAEDARNAPGMPNAEAYIKEVLTGDYAGELRVMSKRTAK